MNVIVTANERPIDRYLGDMKPVTKVRHGTGRFIYANSFFTYEGDWVDGVKHGTGKLSMKDGSFYEGQFQNGEIMGQGIMQYANRGVYRGSFCLGEKHGNGNYESPNGESYQGGWNMNLKEGAGVDRSQYGDLITGTFLQNKAHGECRIEYADGSVYQGFLQAGKRYGQGTLKDVPNQILYEGDWVVDKKEGTGILHILSQQYKYEGQFLDDVACLIGNRLIYNVLTPPAESIDPNDKKAKDQPVLDPNAIHYEINGLPITIEFTVVFQGQDIEDPVQPSKEEIDELVKNWQKEAKKQKNPPPMPDFGAKRMIPAAPVPIVMESGRLLKIDLVSRVDDLVSYYKVDYRDEIAARRQEITKIKEQMEQEAAQLQAAVEPVAKGSKKDPKKQTKQVKQENEVDLSVKLFNPDSREVKNFSLWNQSLIVPNRNGKIMVNDLEFPEDFPVGKYQLCVSNASTVIGTFEPVVLDLVVYAPGGIELLRKGGKKK